MNTIATKKYMKVSVDTDIICRALSHAKIYTFVASDFISFYVLKLATTESDSSNLFWQPIHKIQDWIYVEMNISKNSKKETFSSLAIRASGTGTPLDIFLQLTSQTA